MSLLFETEFCCVAKAGLEFASSLSLPPAFWDCKRTRPLCKGIAAGVIVNKWGLFLGPIQFNACGFSWQISHMSGISCTGEGGGVAMET